MNPMPLPEFARRCNGRLVGSTGDTIESFALDSREANQGSLFIAVKGERSDGHDFVSQALERGAVATLAERSVPGPHILVKSVVEALAAFGASKRDEFKGPVIGITGSAGKTSTKEFLVAALAPLGPILKTEGNRNTELTVPLAWAELRPDHKAAVIEMAMRGEGQIAHLASFCKPEVGIVTQIGYAHAEKVGSREAIARAKAELVAALPKDGTAVLWAQDDFLALLQESTKAEVRTFGFENADCLIESYRPLNWESSQIMGTLDGKPWTARVPAVGRHMALNAAAAILAAAVAGVSSNEAASALGSAKLPPMRMEVRRLGNITIVIDAYNASPGSMVAAIETMTELPAKGRKLAVIGEMRELGDASAAGHETVGRALLAANLDALLLVGPETIACEVEGLQAERSTSMDDVGAFLAKAQAGDVVLIKGSRALELEQALDVFAERVS